MLLLNHLKLRSKLAILLGMATLAVIGSIGTGLSIMRDRMTTDRIEKLRTVVEMTSSLARFMEAEVQAGRLTHDQALGQFRSQVHALRYDEGTGYLVVQGEDDVILAFGPDPKRDGTPSSARDASGRSNADQIREVLRHAGDGVITYFYPKPGETVPKQKLAFVARFAPWKAVILTGVWVDDLEADYRTSLTRLSIVGGLIVLTTVLVAWLINRDISGSLDRLRVAMESLSHGDLSAAVPGTERRDEVGWVRWPDPCWCFRTACERPKD